MPINATTDNYYNGINALSLWVISQKENYHGAEWATYRQWQSLGAQVAKGEKGSKIVIYKPLPKTEENDGDRPKVLLRSAMEELVAELGSAFACVQLGVTNSPRQDHADYIASWINVLEKDPKAVFWASARASEAVAYLNSLQP